MKKNKKQKITNLKTTACKEIYGRLYPITRIILEANGTAAGSFKNGATIEKNFFVRSTLI
jgi:hypothetical protein